MISLDQIQDMARKAARKARERGDLPMSFPLGFDPEDLRHIPYTGTLKFPGYKFVESLFVDASGMGDEDEPAMTFRAFTQYVREHVPYGYCYAISQAGEFQVYIDVYQSPAYCKIARI